VPEFIITASELHAALGKVVLIDVREPEEFAECRIAGGTLIPLGDLQGRAPRELDKKSDIVVYCAHGVRSMHGLKALKMLGFENVRSLEGGIAHYEEQFPVLR
jgi:rhodanese-related sulfurtransferase